MPPVQLRGQGRSSGFQYTAGSVSQAALLSTEHPGGICLPKGKDLEKAYWTASEELDTLPRRFSPAGFQTVEAFWTTFQQSAAKKPACFLWSCRKGRVTRPTAGAVSEVSS